MLDEYENEKLYKKYLESTDKESVMNEILSSSETIFLINKVVNKYMDKYFLKDRASRDDLFMAAWTKIPQLIEKYNSNYNVKLFNYLIEQCEYAVKDEVRVLQDKTLSRGVEHNLKVFHLILQKEKDLDKAKEKFKKIVGFSNDSTVDNYIEMYFQGKDYMRLDNKLKDDEFTTHLDTLSSTSLNPEEKFFDESRSDILNKYMEKVLSQREKEFLVANKINNVTITQIGEQYNVSKQYVSKTIKKAEAKLRNSSLKKELDELTK